MSTFADLNPAQSKEADADSDRSVRELLQCEMRLAQELVDIRHDRVRAIASQLLGERPPDPEGLERLRSVTRELEIARQSLVEATCRWHYFVFRGNLLS